MAKFCSECGKPVQPEWNLCPTCGFKLKISNVSQNTLITIKPTIIFKSKGYYCEGKPHGYTLSGNMKKGFIVLSNADIIFTFRQGSEFILPITEILKVEKFSRRGYVFIKISTKTSKSYTFWSANVTMGQYHGGKSNELHALLTQLVKSKTLLMIR